MTKYAFITGANKGIGYELVRQLAEKNYYVFLGARKQTLGQDAAASLGFSNVSFVPVDVTDSLSIQRAAETIANVTGHLDLLINNAGISLDHATLPSALEVDTLKKEFDVNFFGAFQIIQAFLPFVKQAEGGTIINVTTDMASQTKFDRGETAPINALGYNSSKTAVNALTLAFGKEFDRSDLEIFGVTPGFTTTDLNGNQPGGSTPAESAAVIVTYALSSENYHGKILDKNGIMPW